MKTYPTLLTLSVFLLSISLSAQSLIVNRWVVAGKLNREEAFPIGNLQEYEFFKDNRYRIYEGGTVIVNGNYEMAKDGKSYTLGTGKTSLKVKIIKLTALEMHIVYDIDIALNDTIVYYMTGTPAARIAQKKYNYADEYFKNWSTLKNIYKRRSDIAIEIINTLKPKISGIDTVITDIKKYIIKAELFLLDGPYIPQVQILQYSFMQENLSAEITKLLQMTENGSDIKSGSDFSGLKIKLSELEKELAKAKAKFNVAFKAYYGL